MNIKRLWELPAEAAPHCEQWFKEWLNFDRIAQKAQAKLDTAYLWLEWRDRSPQVWLDRFFTPDEQALGPDEVATAAKNIVALCDEGYELTRLLYVQLVAGNYDLSYERLTAIAEKVKGSLKS